MVSIEELEARIVQLEKRVEELHMRTIGSIRLGPRKPQTFPDKVLREFQAKMEKAAKKGR